MLCFDPECVVKIYRNPFKIAFSSDGFSIQTFPLILSVSSPILLISMLIIIDPFPIRSVFSNTPHLDSTHGESIFEIPRIQPLVSGILLNQHQPNLNSLINLKVKGLDFVTRCSIRIFVASTIKFNVTPSYACPRSAKDNGSTLTAVEPYVLVMKRYSTPHNLFE